MRRSQSLLALLALLALPELGLAVDPVHPTIHSGPPPASVPEAATPSPADEATTGERLACPTGSFAIQSAYLPNCQTLTTQFISWNQPFGADTSTIYEVMLGTTAPDYCALNPQGASYTVFATTPPGQTSITVSGLPSNVAFPIYIRVQGCPSVRTQNTLDSDAFSSPLGQPSLQATVSGNNVMLTYSESDPKTFGILYLERAVGSGSFQAVSGFPGGSQFQDYCPAGSQKQYTDSGLSPGTYQYRLVAEGDAANCFNYVYSNGVTVTVGAAAPTISGFTASPSTITPGQSSLLSWQSSGGSTASIDTGVGTVPTNGSISVSPQQTTTYTLTVTSASGASVTAKTTVTVSAPAPTITFFSANPPSISTGGTSTLFWGSNNATSAFIDNGIGNVSPNGQIDVRPTQTTTYTLTVVGPGGQTSAQTRVTVSASCSGTVDCTATVPASAKAGDSVFFVVNASPPSGCSSTPAYFWEFGDGRTSGEQFPTVVYQNPGAYNWRVTASIPGTTSCVNSGSITITSSGPRITSFAANPGAIDPGQSSTLTWASTGGATARIDPGVGPVQTSGSTTVSPTTTTTYQLSVTSSDGITSTATAGVTVRVPCNDPGRPAFTVSSGSLTAGQSYVATWTAAPALATGGVYVVETSRSSFFSSIDSSTSTSATFLVIPTFSSDSPYTLYVRVKAVQVCATAGPYSATLTLGVRPNPAAFVITRSGPSFTAAFGDAPPSGIVTIRNVGGLRGRASLSVRGSFFDVNPSTLDIDAGTEAAVTLTVKATALTAAGAQLGALLVGTDQSTPVSLTVTATPTAPGSRAGTKARANVTTVVFDAPTNQNPPPQNVTVVVSPIVGSGPVVLSPSIAPGGGWLQIAGLERAVDSSGVATLTLSVDRSKRSPADGPPPLRTLLKLLPVGGSPSDNDADAALIEIVDVDPPVVTPGAGDRGGSRPELAAPSGGSFIVPTTVKGSGAKGAVYFSDGWLSNLGSAAVPASLYYTPQDKNGLADPSVLKSSVTIAAGATLRLSDLLSSLFDLNPSSGVVTGQVEVRSTTPQALTLRTTVEAVTGGDVSQRFGADIPIVAFGSGIAALQGEVVLPGINDNSVERSNLILTETTGQSVDVKVTIHGSDGAVLGSFAKTVPPFGKLQIGNVVSATTGASVSAGWLGVTATGGGGKVVPLATVSNNITNSFSAIKGAVQSSASSAAPLATSPLVSPTAYIIPSAVRTYVASFSTQFVTTLSFVNGRPKPANLSLTYNYIDQDDGNAVKVATKSVTLQPFQSLPAALGDDALVGLFGLTNRTYGWIKVEGDVAQVNGGGSAIKALPDPSDPTNFKKAPLAGLLTGSPDLMTIGQVEHRYTGIEKSPQKRTNFIIVETAGQSADVRVRLNGPSGRLAEKVFSVGANQYFQINDVFGPGGLALGDGPFQNIEITAQVIGGSGRIFAFATVNDNYSRNPEIFPLTNPGPPDPTMGYQ